MLSDTRTRVAVSMVLLACALCVAGCGTSDSTAPEKEPAVGEPTVLEGRSHTPTKPSAELVEQCKIFEPPWGAGSWTEWGQSHPEEGELWYNSIGDTMKNADFSLLPKCKHLKNVFVGMSALTDLKPLAGLTGLERLDLRFVEELTDLVPLESLENLEYLNISGTGVTDLTPLTKLPKLRDLEARTLKITDAAAVAEMNALTKVDFLKVPLVDLTPMAKAPKLADILVCNTKVATLAPLYGVTARVRGLDLCGTAFEDYDVLAKFDKLTFLRLSSKPIADLSPIAGLTQLANLDINGTKIKDLAPLVDMVEMKQLDLSELELEDLSPLYGMKKLETLYVVKSKIDAKQIAALKVALPNAKILDEY